MAAAEAGRSPIVSLQKSNCPPNRRYRALTIACGLSQFAPKDWLIVVTVDAFNTL